MIDEQLYNKAVTDLKEIYTEVGVNIWLQGRKKSLEGKSPLDLMEENKYDIVFSMIEQLHFSM